jgi:hypothetical protein
VRVTGFWALAGLVVLGIIAADVLTHPAGTKQAGSTLVSLEKNTGNQLLGSKA